MTIGARTPRSGPCRQLARTPEERLTFHPTFGRPTRSRAPSRLQYDPSMSSDKSLRAPPPGTSTTRFRWTLTILGTASYECEREPDITAIRLQEHSDTNPNLT